jgi:threonine dehydrogenase-like Zn-dependent dehydrogenase
MSYTVGSLIFDNWGTPYSAIKRTSMKEGDIVVVTGCGPIGLAAIALSKHRGARVIAVDPVKVRREAAMKLGAQMALQPGKNIHEVISELSNNEGADIFLECSGKASSYEYAFANLRIGGTLVSIGEGAEFLLNSSGIIHKHLTIIGSLYSTIKDGQEIQDLIVKGEIDSHAFLSHTFELEELPSLFEKVINMEDGVLKAVVVR